MRAALTGLGYPLELFTDPELKELPRDDMYGRSPRDMLISIGAWGRRISPTFWTDRMMASAPSNVAGLVISDIGTDWEIKFARFELGAPIVRLKRPGVERIEDGRVQTWPDKVIYNHRTPEETAAEVDRFAQEWRLAA